ncbi:MAG: YgaP-like transmembrane domain [Acidimicrobiales bacterium]
MALIRFLESKTGRYTRSVAGLALIGLGAGLGGVWWVLAAVGIVPLAAGLFNFCLVAPLFHVSLRHAPHRA